MVISSSKCKEATCKSHHSPNSPTGIFVKYGTNKPRKILKF